MSLRLVPHINLPGYGHEISLLIGPSQELYRVSYQAETVAQQPSYRRMFPRHFSTILFPHKDPALIYEDYVKRNADLSQPPAPLQEGESVVAMAAPKTSRQPVPFLTWFKAQCASISQFVQNSKEKSLEDFQNEFLPNLFDLGWIIASCWSVFLWAGRLYLYLDKNINRFDVGTEDNPFKIVSWPERYYFFHFGSDVLENFVYICMEDSPRKRESLYPFFYIFGSPFKTLYRTDPPEESPADRFSKGNLKLDHLDKGGVLTPNPGKESNAPIQEKLPKGRFNLDHLFDTTTGKPAAGRPEGHAGARSSASFSLDNLLRLPAYLIECSWDKGTFDQTFKTYLDDIADIFVQKVLDWLNESLAQDRFTVSLGFTHRLADSKLYYNAVEVFKYPERNFIKKMASLAKSLGIVVPEVNSPEYARFQEQILKMLKNYEGYGTDLRAEAKRGNGHCYLPNLNGLVGMLLQLPGEDIPIYFYANHIEESIDFDYNACYTFLENYPSEISKKHGCQVDRKS